jgi:DNA-binding NtrC family response regulator
MATILVVDDELGIRDLLFEILNDEGHQVELAMNAAQARSIRATLQPDLVLLDIWMPDTDGVTLLKEWATTGLLNMPVVMMSGHATIDTAVEATRIGAMAFLEKPITMQKLLKAVEQGLNRKWAGAGRGATLPQASGTDSQQLGRGVCDALSRRLCCLRCCNRYKALT